MKILIAIIWIFCIVNVQILNIRERERVVPRGWGWPRVSYEKISVAIISVFCNIYLETHNTIESIHEWERSRVCCVKNQ